MQINPINNLYSQKLGFSGLDNKKSPTSFEIEEPKIDRCNSYEFEKEYEKNVLKALNERKDELYAYIDSIKDEDGLTYTDKFEKMLDVEGTKVGESTFLHKTLSENMENLQKNGFDPEKIKTTEYGPGFYVGTSESVLTIYSGATMKVKYKGNTTEGRNLSKYNTIRSKIVGSLRDYLGLETDFRNPLMRCEFGAFNTFVDEYARNTISKKLKIDGAHVREGQGFGYFVIFNPDSVTEIKPLD